MKTLFASLLLVLAPAAWAQHAPFAHGSAQADRPTITSVAPSMAYGPGAVEIRGLRLDLIEKAKVNTVGVPIAHKDARLLVIRPPEQVPGFGQLQLCNVNTTLTAPIEFLPSLSGRWAGEQIQLRLNPGQPGWYMMEYSFRRLDMLHVVEGVHYGLWLDMTAPYSGLLFSGVLATDDPVVFPWMSVPRGLVGAGGLGTLRPMRVQAFCMLGDELAYTNLLTLQPTL